MKRNDAKTVLKLLSMWNETDKNTMLDRISERLSRIGYKTVAEQRDFLSKITGAGEHTVYAWFNRSRQDVKIPLIKLCIISNAIGEDVKKFLRK